MVEYSAEHDSSNSYTMYVQSKETSVSTQAMGLCIQVWGFMSISEAGRGFTIAATKVNLPKKLPLKLDGQLTTPIVANPHSPLRSHSCPRQGCSSQ